LTEVNVGPVGGDLASRRFAFVITLVLTVMALPQSGVGEHALRLAALVVALCGTLFLMAGLVFLQKTHYAGIMLIVSSCGIIALEAAGMRPGAVVLGLAFMGIITANLWNRRCELNRMMGINSCA
jgi:hypothetical protein